MSLALALALTVTAPHPIPATTCVTQWFARAGPAPNAPHKPEHPTPEQSGAYNRELAAYKPVATRYAAAAKTFGQACILGDRPRHQRSNSAEAMRLIAAAVDARTSFVASPPADIADFCPGYTHATLDQRTRFWHAFFLAIIQPESGYNNASLMLDGHQYSIGLYQVSLDNGCAAKTELSLTDPAANTACAVHVMERLERPRLDEHGKPANIIGGEGQYLRRGAASYWSTLRAVRASPSGPVTGPRRNILDTTRAVEGCHAAG